jgi:hypothetical protein
MLRRLLYPTLFLPVLFFGCQEPRSYLDQVIQAESFIPFELPMASTRVGTILRGNNKEMYLVARPERCFPDLPDEQSLRWTQTTNLPDEDKKIQVGFNTDLNAVLGTGNPTVTLKASATYVKTVQIEFTNASVEFLDEMSFYDYYDHGMSDDCKSALSRYPFIGQGLRIESMKFTFQDSLGGNIDLTGKLSDIVDISAGVNWSLADNYTLVIDSPKYIGYRMAKLSPGQGGPAIAYATSTDKDGAWLFHDVESALSGFLPGARPAEPLELEQGRGSP